MILGDLLEIIEAKVGVFLAYQTSIQLQLVVP
jgi:hypothetical protein